MRTTWFGQKKLALQVIQNFRNGSQARVGFSFLFVLFFFFFFFLGSAREVQVLQTDPRRVHRAVHGSSYRRGGEESEWAVVGTAVHGGMGWARILHGVALARVLAAPGTAVRQQGSLFRLLNLFLGTRRRRRLRVAPVCGEQVERAYRGGGDEKRDERGDARDRDEA